MVYIVCTPPPTPRAKVRRRNWNFEFLGRSKFLISGGGRLYFLGGGQFILRLFSRFEMQNFRNSKLFACSALIFNIYIFRFKMDAGLRVDTDFNTESKFSCSSSNFFFTPQWALKTNQTHETSLFFIHLVGLEGPPNHPVSNTRAFYVNLNKQQLLVKTESDPFVNERPCTTRRRVL